MKINNFKGDINTDDPIILYRITLSAKTGFWLNLFIFCILFPSISELTVHTRKMAGRRWKMGAANGPVPIGEIDRRCEASNREPWSPNATNSYACPPTPLPPPPPVTKYGTVHGFMYHSRVDTTLSLLYCSSFSLRSAEWNKEQKSSCLTKNLFE